MEKIQYRALRHVYNDFVASYIILREKANMPLMYVQRLRQMMIEVYTVYQNIGPVYMENLFNKADQFYNNRCAKPLEPPSFNTITYGYNYFTCQSAKQWNL